MTTLIDDPLIAAMTIDRMLPLHESSQRLRQLYPQCPRVYGVAVQDCTPASSPIGATSVITIP